ncbi:metal ABC transporter permease [Candidatus Leptofilum sp.]|uniref:metal ABC transporter permease n=1 Tax=Candidatus Leptofilum sp. TaxID=3241576 RepID=UPI003B5A2AAD
MYQLEQLFISFLLNFFDHTAVNAFFRDPQNTATLIGGLIAISGALLGTFLLLRGMSLTSDAISHTVLLGIVVAFLVMTSFFQQEPDLSSPWLIIGAALAGVATVVLTEAIYRSGLVKQDAALGLAFPLLFAVAVILVSRYVQDVHLDEDAVMVGEIGVAWADTNSHCLANCETVTITPDDPRAEISRRCINCRELAISPRDEGAEFVEACGNCGTYTPALAWQAGLVASEPLLIFWPKSITVMLLITGLTILFVTLFFKELKLSTFDSALAAALGFWPALLNYALMITVSLVAVGAFEAVGSILVIAFFIIPPAAAYLLTDNLTRMLVYSSVIGAVGAYFGYDLARGTFLGLFQLDAILVGLNRLFNLNLLEDWDSSISASMVLMIFFFFLVSWVLSPKYGLVSTLLRRRRQRHRFDNQVVLAHIHNHEGTSREQEELAIETLYAHFRWSPQKTRRMINNLQARSYVHVQGNMVRLTSKGKNRVRVFRETQLARETVIQ